jgi:hypothetical protein
MVFYENHINTYTLYHAYTVMDMDAIVVCIPSYCKEELEQKIKENTPTENEGVLRIGLQCIHTMRTSMFQGMNVDMQREYEEKLAQKDQERVVWEHVFRQHQDKVFEERTSQLRAEKDRMENRLQTLEAEKRDQKERDEIKWNNERDKLREHYEQMYEGLMQKQRQMQEQHMYAIDNERKTAALQQDEQYKKFQEDLLALTSELNQTKEAYSSCKRMQEIDIQHHINIEIDKRKHVENELVRTKESMEMNQKLLEMEWTQRVNNAKQTAQHTINDREKQLHAELEATRAKALEMEVKYLQSIGQERTMREEELKRMREQLSEATATIEAIKVESLTAAIEQQRQQFEDIKNELKVNQKSSAGLGKVGEEYFRELAEQTFVTYDDFELEDKTKTGHSGDFHLRFSQFSVLVDTKNFEVGKISTVDVAKFRRDMSANPSIRVGWLISLNGHISKYGKRPYLFEIEDGRLLVFINNLRHLENPGKILEDLYYMSSFLYEQIINAESNTEVLCNYKRYEKRVKENVEKLSKLCKKTKAAVAQIQEDVNEVERTVQDMMNENILEIRNEHATAVEQWWSESMAETEGGKIKSNVLYTHFVQTKGPTSIKMDMFKNILKGMLPAHCLQLPKVDKSQYVILGFKLK